MVGSKISADEMQFYESSGKVVAVSADGQDVLVSMAMEGEGETWTSVMRLSLNGTGSSLRLSTSDGTKPKVKDDYPRKRCS